MYDQAIKQTLFYTACVRRSDLQDRRLPDLRMIRYPSPFPFSVPGSCRTAPDASCGAPSCTALLNLRIKELIHPTSMSSTICSRRSSFRRYGPTICPGAIHARPSAARSIPGVFTSKKSFPFFSQGSFLHKKNSKYGLSGSFDPDYFQCLLPRCSQFIPSVSFLLFQFPDMCPV